MRLWIKGQKQSEKHVVTDVEVYLESVFDNKIGIFVRDVANPELSAIIVEVRPDGHIYLPTRGMVELKKLGFQLTDLGDVVHS